MADYLGGLSMAIKKLSGSYPSVNILLTANKLNPEIVSLQNYIALDFRTRFLNLDYIKGMMSEGQPGANRLSTGLRSFLVWQVTNPEVVKSWMWDEMVNTYLKDQYNLGATKWLSSGNQAFDLISMSGTMLTAIHMGYWKADKATTELIAKTWSNMIAQNGVACCDCSCGNIAMMKWAVQFINPNILAQFNAQIYQATKNSMFAPPAPAPMPTEPRIPTTPEAPTPTAPEAPSPGEQPSPATPTSPGEQPSATEVQAATAQEPSAGEKGEKTYEVTKVTPPSSAAGGIPIWAVLGVILLTSLAILGYFKSSILGFILRR